MKRLARAAAIAIFTIIAMGCDSRPPGKPTNMSTPDWNALAFACTHEASTLPAPSQEAQTIYREANAFYSDGSNRDDSQMLKRAFELWTEAANLGHVKAMYNVAIAYRDGTGTKRSESKAVEWAEKLIDRKVGMGYFLMGTFLREGVGVRADPEKALIFIRKSADLGYPQGQLEAGKAMIDAFRQHPDRQRGFEIGESMLKCAQDQKLAEAGYELGFHLARQDGKTESALKSFQAAAKLGHRQSLYMLFSFFAKEGAVGFEIDPNRAACYERMWRRTEAEPGITFPDIDKVCPLPPTKMP